MTNAPALVLAATAALILTPGWLLARAWGARGTTALGAAPALSLAILGPATLLAQRSSQRWAPAILLTGWPMVLLVSGIVTGLVCTWLGRRAAAGRGEGLDRPAMGRRDALEFAGALVLAVVLTAIPVAVGTNGWDSPAQASDGVFHLSATAFVRLTGDASFLGGLAPMYDGMSVYYPTGWHALASLLPGDVVTGANAMVAVLGALVWPLSMAALLREVLRDTGRSLAVGGALAGSVIAPLLMLTSVWPYGLSVVVLPGALALLVRAVRRGSVGAVRRGSAWMLAGLGALGVVMAHGTGVFNLVVLGLPVVIMGDSRLCAVSGCAAAWRAPLWCWPWPAVWRWWSAGPGSCAARSSRSSASSGVCHDLGDAVRRRCRPSPAGDLLPLDPGQYRGARPGCPGCRGLEARAAGARLGGGRRCITAPAPPGHRAGLAPAATGGPLVHPARPHYAAADRGDARSGSHRHPGGDTSMGY